VSDAMNTDERLRIKGLSVSTVRMLALAKLLIHLSSAQ